MKDLVVEADVAGFDLGQIPVIAVGMEWATTLSADGELMRLDLVSAAQLASETPHLLVNMPMVARRLGLGPFRAFDLLELFAFVRPARFCLPTVRGVMNELRLDMPLNSLDDELMVLKSAALRLQQEMQAETYGYRAGASDVATDMAKAGWPWGPCVVQAMERYRDTSGEDGNLVWRNLADIEDQAPPPPPDDLPVVAEESLSRLKDLLGPDAEERPGQGRYARAATHAFTPREMEDGPNLQLLEAGTGTGKTLGYIAPASLWAEKNEGPVWVSTFTKNLQRQLDQELTRLYPDPRKKAKHAVVRKGRENYACLLNIEETARAVKMRAGFERDKILMGLVMRWARFSRDGDMIGGDFPSWLAAHFGAGRIAGLTDRRGECLYSACAHFRKCYVEKAVRKARYADLVIANHALVIAQAATREGDPDLPKRLVFDEGHHIFDAADGAFSVALTGLEGAELRRWLRGKEQGGSTRARGIKSRLSELIGGDNDAEKLLDEVLEGARLLPTDGWQNRLAQAAPLSKFEDFLLHIRTQVLARGDDYGPHGIEIPVGMPIEGLASAAEELHRRLDDLVKPMKALSAYLLQMLDEESDTLDSSERGRVESSARSLLLRAEMVATWQVMAAAVTSGAPEGVIDWFELDRIEGRERDVGMHRHMIDPSEAFAKTVLSPASGVLITSATLRDKGDEQPAINQQLPAANDDISAQAKAATANHIWRSADMRTGAQHLQIPPKRLSVDSPFDYPTKSKVIIIGDVNKNDPRQVAAAYRVLFQASGGSALGLFTAISRLRAVYGEIAPALEADGIPLYAQHVDPMDTATLVDIFRDEIRSCLLGTDAVRDGVDVPGESLRLIVFDRVPWPRPTILHKARRGAFGGRQYDEMLTRLKLSQAFGRLNRRADDRGIFVMLDGQTPTRLLAALPSGVEIIRCGLSEAVTNIDKFFNPRPEEMLVDNAPTDYFPE